MFAAILYDKSFKTGHLSAALYYFFRQNMIPWNGLSVWQIDLCHDACLSITLGGHRVKDFSVTEKVFNQVLLCIDVCMFDPCDGCVTLWYANGVGTPAVNTFFAWHTVCKMWYIVQTAWNNFVFIRYQEISYLKDRQAQQAIKCAVSHYLSTKQPWQETIAYKSNDVQNSDWS